MGNIGRLSFLYGPCDGNDLGGNIPQCGPCTRFIRGSYKIKIIMTVSSMLYLALGTLIACTEIKSLIKSQVGFLIEGKTRVAGENSSHVTYIRKRVFNRVS